jgi:hypothetical protein
LKAIRVFSSKNKLLKRRYEHCFLSYIVGISAETERGERESREPQYSAATNHFGEDKNAIWEKHQAESFCGDKRRSLKKKRR